MAQVWVTHEELASLCDCSPAEARASVRLRNWTKRTSSDGEIRIKLPEDLAYAYMTAAVGRSALDRIADANVSELESMLNARDAKGGDTASKAA